MLIGILSDTHDEMARTRRAVAQLRDAGAEALIHCGDFTDPLMVTACAVLPLWFVFGNNDADETPALERVAAQCGATCLGWADVVELGGKRIAVAHGHMSYDIRRLLAARPDYLLTGHSHIAADSLEGGVRRINPGALHRANEYSVALLETESGEVRFVPVER